MRFNIFMSLFNKDQGSSASGGDEIDKLLNTEDSESVEFVPAVPPSAKGNTKTAASLGASLSSFMTADNAQKAFTMMNALRSGDATGAAKVMAGLENSELIGELLANAISSINVNPSKDQAPPKGGGGGGGFSNSFANANRLSADMAPTEVRLATGIRPNVYSPDYHTAEVGYAAPLHVSIVNFRFPNVTANNTTAAYVIAAIMPDILNRVQSNVGFTLPANFTSSNLVVTLNHLCAALEMYYSISRLLVYGNDPMNKNEALLYMRGQLTSSVTDDFLMLKRVLEGIPIPPNLNTMIFYFSQIYLSSELPGSPAIMTAPHPFTNGNPDWSSLSTIRSNLTNNVSTTIFSVLGKAFTNWYSVQPLTGISNPLHDPNFNTIWCNLPYDVSRLIAPTSSIKGPPVTTITSEFRYNSWTNNLDGGAYALMSAWKTTTTTGWIPGFIIPNATAVNSNYTTSRISWLDKGSGPSFFESDDTDHSTFSREETYTTSSRFTTPFFETHLAFGSERCFGVSPRSIQDTAIKLADWLMSFDTIPKPGAKFARPATGYNPKRSYSDSKSSSKPKGKSNRGKRNDQDPPNDEL
jgi:hypothetical protein